MCAQHINHKSQHIKRRRMVSSRRYSKSSTRKVSSSCVNPLMERAEREKEAVHGMTTQRGQIVATRRQIGSRATTTIVTRCHTVAETGFNPAISPPVTASGTWQVERDQASVGVERGPTSSLRSDSIRSRRRRATHFITAAAVSSSSGWLYTPLGNPPFNLPAFSSCMQPTWMMFACSILCLLYCLIAAKQARRLEVKRYASVLL